MQDHVMKFGVGQPVRRREDDRFLRGAGRFVDDIRHEGQLYAAFLRSPHAHALIEAIDGAGAKAAPGVLAVYTHHDADANGLTDMGDVSGLTNADGSGIAPVKTPHLARGRVRYVGQPVAMVVAESAAAARDALELIEVDFTDLPAVTTPAEALTDTAPQLHDAAPNNLAYEWEMGEREATDAAFAQAAHRVKMALPNQRIIVNAMEPRAVNAQYDRAADRWTLHVGTQGSHAMRGRVAAGLGIPADKAADRLRVVTPDVGGGFGMKLMVHPEYALCALAAKLLNRPVKWTADRTESFLADVQGRDVHGEIEGAFDAEGRLLAIRFDGLSNLGGYYSQVGAAIHTIFSVPLLGAMYRCPLAHARVRGVFTNTTPTDAFRGAGRPEMVHFTERLIEQAGRDLGLDPAEIRRRNLLSAAEMPYVTWSNGSTYDSGDCLAMLERGLEVADYAGRQARKEEAAARGKLLGVGLTYYMERTGGGPVENARIRVRPDGRITAWIGTQSTGQGHETAWAQLIHERLGVDPDAIDFPAGDSDLLPAGGGTGGSRSLIMGHRSFFNAADDLIEKARQTASEKLEASVADIEFSREEGGLFRIAGTDRSISLFDLAEGQTDELGGEALLGVGGVTDRTSSFPNGVHVAEVEIDPETGRATLARFTMVDDFGRIVNPLLAEGQSQGGAAQGIGQALCEGAVYDPETGQPLTGSYMDYQLPRAGDLPMFEGRFVEDWPCETNPLGVKGCGEAGTVGGTPAVMLAVLDALRDRGVSDIAMPTTPQRIWAALHG